MALPPSSADLSTLDTRARDIFREIVESYLTTGEPVGSRTLSKLGGVGLSPASIRNTMADLTALGLIDAPHAMAGRRPTQAGLRFFVDSLLQLGEVAEPEKREIEERVARAGTSPQDVLGAASELLSGLAGGAGLVVTPERDAPVRHAAQPPRVRRTRSAREALEVPELRGGPTVACAWAEDRPERGR